MTSIILQHFSIILFSVVLIYTHAAPTNYQAAMCIIESKRCSSNTSIQTERIFKQAVVSHKQPFKCRVLACKWCMLPEAADTTYCKADPLRSMCNSLNSNRNTCSKSGGMARKNCVWQGRGTDIVVDLGKLAPTLGWKCVKRSSYTGIVYEKNKNLGIGSKGTKGRFCDKARAAQAGNYFFTALSYAPHNTEHNDVWVQSKDKGFELWKGGTLWRISGKNEWLKAYQNNGRKGLIDQLKTKDFDGHRFIVPGVSEGEVFEICLSGRSYKYEMFRLYLIKCTGDFCKGIPYSNLLKKPSSQCNA